MKRKHTFPAGDSGRTSKVKWQKRVIERSYLSKPALPRRQEDDISDTDSVASADDLSPQKSRLLNADLNTPVLEREKLKRTRDARKAVFDTVELLENILLHLPPNDIVNATRVCKNWNDVINGSIVFSPKLFRTLYNSGKVNPLFTRGISPRGHTMKQAIEGYLRRKVKEQGKRGGEILDGMHFIDRPAPKIKVFLNWRVREVVGYALVSLPFKKTGWTVGEALRMAMTTKHPTSWDDHARHCGGSEHSSLIDLFAQLRLDGPDFEIECVEIEFRLQSLLAGAGGHH
ncbi:hypothetical protein BST61_g1893 [Cercospora zeina]